MLEVSILSAFIAGLLAFISPCILPLIPVYIGLILSGILLMASRMETLAEGVLLLSIFSLGLGLPFILASVFISFFSNFFKKINKHLNIIKIISGIFLIALGIVFVTDSMLRIVGYLSKYIPTLDKIRVFNF